MHAGGWSDPSRKPTSAAWGGGESGARVHRKGEASGLRNSAAWAEVTALVDLAHAAARGAAHGGSGEKAEHLLPRDEAEGRTIYVLEYTRGGVQGPDEGLLAEATTEAAVIAAPTPPSPPPAPPPHPAPLPTPKPPIPP